MLSLGHVTLLFVLTGRQKPNSFLPLAWFGYLKQQFCELKRTVGCRLSLASNTSFVSTKVCLSRQTFCRDKLTVVTTNFVFCIDKSMSASTHTCLSRQIFLTTKVLSRQKYFVATNILLCRDKSFVAASILLSRQTRVHGDKGFVATKMILLAAPASDSRQQTSSSSKLRAGCVFRDTVA